MTPSRWITVKRWFFHSGWAIFAKRHLPTGRKCSGSDIYWTRSGFRTHRAFRRHRRDLRRRDRARAVAAGARQHLRLRRRSFRRAFIGTMQPGKARRRFICSTTDPKYTQLYYEKYLPMNPVFPAATFMAARVSFTPRPTSSAKAELEQTRFYQEWIAPQGIADALAGESRKGHRPALHCSISARTYPSALTNENAAPAWPYSFRICSARSTIGRLFDQHKATEDGADGDARSCRGRGLSGRCRRRDRLCQ